jgi:hypothetical protein
MAFWSDTTLDPKRQFKFSVTFNTNRLGNNATFLAQSADRPQYKISDGTKVHFLDKEFSFPGKVTWEPVKIKFVDTGGVSSASKDSYAYLSAAGWVSPTNVGGQVAASGASFKTVSKQSSVANSGDIIINVLDSAGLVADKWTLKNAFVFSVALNGLDYSAEAILTAEYSFRYDWAELK